MQMHESTWNRHICLNKHFTWSFFSFYETSSSVETIQQTIQANLEAINEVDAENDRSGLTLLKQCM